MDAERAIEALEWWVATASGAAGNGPGVPEASPALVLLRAREDQTRRVLARALSRDTLPELLYRHPGVSHISVRSGVDLITYALGKLRTEAETQAILGNDAPMMSADALHPLIWDAASKHWNVGHYSAAVQRAATMLNAEVQDRVGRHDVSDAGLMQQTFSLDAPQAERPRLRWGGEDSDLTVKAMRQGILNMSQGIFSAIRNPATHSTDDMARQEALEQLATLSILARWIDRCELVTV